MCTRIFLTHLELEQNVVENELIERENLKIKPHFSGTHWDDKFATFGVASCILAPAPIFAWLGFAKFLYEIMTMTMTMKIILLSWSYIFIQCTRATTYPMKTIFTCQENMCNAQCSGKMVIILHDNEGMKPWLMGPNLYFTISRCQNRVPGNKVTVQYFGAMLNCHNAKQCLSRTFIGKIMRYQLMRTHIYIYIYTYIYMHIYIYTYALKGND